METIVIPLLYLPKKGQFYRYLRIYIRMYMYMRTSISILRLFEYVHTYMRI